MAAMTSDGGASITIVELVWSAMDPGLLDYGAPTVLPDPGTPGSEVRLPTGGDRPVREYTSPPSAAVEARPAPTGGLADDLVLNAREAPDTVTLARPGNGRAGWTDVTA